jgi:hypothetical protein
MQYQVTANRKHDSSMRTAFLEQIKGYEPEWITLVAGPEDLLDPEGPVSLDNLPVNGYILKLVDVVRFQDGQQLYPVPVVLPDEAVNTEESSGDEREPIEAGQGD